MRSEQKEREKERKTTILPALSEQFISMPDLQHFFLLFFSPSGGVW